MSISLLLGTSWADHPAKPSSEKPVALLPGMDRHHHPIATTSPEVQKFFDQGMLLLFNFNHAEAVRSFRRAAELDPKAVMPQWGIAYALGPNYNRDVDPVDAARNKAACEAAQKAVALSTAAPEHERAYAQAIARRCTLDPKADPKQCETDYARAMAEVAKKYPDDLDAATLYAEALMNLRPWQLWSRAGKPEEGTEELVRVLEDVLRRHPNHAGANHLYIHAMEASPWPERAIPSATRLLDLVPAAGHLLHMPSHLFMHTGDYDLVALANERGAKADEEFFRLTGTAGVYRMMYYTHNLHFLAVARAAQGRGEDAKKAADKLAAEVRPHLKEMPPMQSFLVVPLQVQLRFHRWDDVFQAPAPESGLRVATAFHHYGRACAFAAKGNKAEAAKERRAFEAARTEVPADFPFGPNSAEKVLEVAAAVLDARLAKDSEEAVRHWEKAVRLEDGLKYAEPPDWYYRSVNRSARPSCEMAGRRTPKRCSATTCGRTGATGARSSA